METYREKATRKFKENPWVPLGSLATVGALITASVKMRRGESQAFNHWLRVRVIAQGLTIIALVAGTYTLRPKNAEALSADPTVTRNDVDVERRRVEKVAREKGEFEERLREAEAAHGMEVELRAKGKGKEAAGAVGSEVEESASVTVTPVSGDRWRRWFRWGESSGSAETASSARTTTDAEETKSIDSSKKV